MQPFPRTWVEIDLTAIKHNLSLIRARLKPGTRIALVCKADAYGHGLVPVGRFASQNGADVLAVATVQEGVSLRDAGVSCPIMVMSPTLAIEADQAVFYDLEVFVESLYVARSLDESAERLNKKALVHLKVDTGLHRYGCHPENALEIAQKIVTLGSTKLIGVANHFVDSGADDEKTLKQLSMFSDVVKRIKESGIKVDCVHSANSAGTLKFPDSQFDMVRIGILAYGSDPNKLMEGGCRVSLKWQARITSKRVVKAGETVSYASTRWLERDSIIATLGVGYGDGYPRLLSNKGLVWCADKYAEVVGLVCMDQMLIDVSDNQVVEIGDVVELLGEHVLVADVSKTIGTIPHEILTRIMSRVNRRYIHE